MPLLPTGTRTMTAYERARLAELHRLAWPGVATYLHIHNAGYFRESAFCWPGLLFVAVWCWN